MSKINYFILLLAIQFLSSCSFLREKEEKEQKTIVQNETMYSNPILAGFYPDPSICKVDDTYYLINSTFSYYPGIPIFKSNDLVNWEQVGNVLDRPEQLDLDGLQMSKGIFAPAISYNEGTYYVVCTVVGGRGNFVVTSKKPEGPWSNPIWIPEVNGIDPSLFFDDSGKAYIVYNSDAPNNQPLYNGHRTIRLYEFDSNNLKIVEGSDMILVNGGTDLAKKPIWIEGPHIYKRNNYYYLIAAEGGTAEDHSEVVFRSKNVTGPYISFEDNPILTQRHLDPLRTNPVTSVGHADFIEDNNGQWWSVFLGCRPYKENFYNTGRETFLAKVNWNNDWPNVDLEGDLVKYKYNNPTGVLSKAEFNQHKRESTYFNDFNDSELGFEWLFLRTPRDSWYNLSDGYLELQTRAECASYMVNPSFIGYRQEHLIGSVSTEMSFSSEYPNEKSGLMIFQNESHYYLLCVSVDGKKPVVQLVKSDGTEINVIAQKEIGDDPRIQLKVNSEAGNYSFYFSENSGKKWTLLKDEVDASFLSTKAAGGFLGCVYGMYSSSHGEDSNRSAKFYWFKNENKDLLN